MLNLIVLIIPAINDSAIIGLAIVLILCVSALYLSKEFLLMSGAVFNVLFIGQQLLNHSFQGNNFIKTLSCVEFVIFVLFFLCKWGGDLIRSLTKKEANTRELLNSLDNVVKVIEENTSSLNQDISNCNEGTSTLKEISNSISITVKDITKGVVGQSESLNYISEMMNSADEKMTEINQISKDLADTSSNVSKVVFDGAEGLKNMDKQMGIINIAVSESLGTVEELSKNMDEVNNSLTSITQISEQTNLLALNNIQQQQRKCWRLQRYRIHI